MSFFSDIIIKWYSKHKRNLPWRNTKNPYKIWISEIILQQTKVNQGLPYYSKFIKKFPNFSVLANANEEEVMKLWQLSTTSLMRSTTRLLICSIR